MTAVYEERVTAQQVRDRSKTLRGSSVSDHGSGAVLGGCKYDKITDADIRAGIRGNGRACALAFVLDRMFPGADVNIDGEHPTVNGSPLAIDHQIVDWIGKFDRGEDVVPLDIRVTYW